MYPSLLPGWGARGGSLAGSWFISDTNMLWGMFCFGVKCECVYSPLEEDMHCALCIVQHVIQSATDTRSRGSASVQRSSSSADFYMMCMFARVTVPCAGWWLDVCIRLRSGVFQKEEDLLSSFWKLFSFQISRISSLMTRISSTSWYSDPLTVWHITRSTASVA